MNLANYVACGYLITQPVERIAWGAELLPEKILSISSELCPRVPDYLAMPWANMDPGERYRESTTAHQLGLSRENFEQIGTCVTLLWKTDGLKWMDVFAAPEIARHFITETLAPHRDRLLIWGLHLVADPRPPCRVPRAPRHPAEPLGAARDRGGGRAVRRPRS